MDCLFCKIAAGTIPAKIQYKSDKVLAFSDINPQAPTHLLIIPREHISTLNELEPQNALIITEMTKTAVMLAETLKLSDKGYRLVMNCNADAGQTVFHLHMHLLGGRVMAWPPG